MDTKLTGWLDLIIKSGVGWVNKAFEFFGLYTSKYAKVILILIGVWIFSKFMKINLGGGKR